MRSCTTSRLAVRGSSSTRRHGPSGPARSSRTIPTPSRGRPPRADRVAAGQFDLLGYRGLTFSTGGQPAQIDWQLDPVHQRSAPQMFWSRVPYLEPACGDHKVVWELNRHQSWLLARPSLLADGRSRYRDAFIAQFNSWMAVEPAARRGELGQHAGDCRCGACPGCGRCTSFSGASGRHERAETFAVDRRSPSRARPAAARSSSRTSPATSAPTRICSERRSRSTSSAARCRNCGAPAIGSDSAARCSSNKSRKQIHADGGHAELSTHYHRYTLDFYLLALAVARQTVRPAGAGLRGGAERLAQYARTMADDTGRLPGDRRRRRRQPVSDLRPGRRLTSATRCSSQRSCSIDRRSPSARRRRRRSG